MAEVNESVKVLGASEDDHLAKPRTSVINTKKRPIGANRSRSSRNVKVENNVVPGHSDSVAVGVGVRGEGSIK